MKVVSICFSGQPRAILKYKDAWQDYFAMLRKKYIVRTFFHSWSDEGFVKFDGQSYVEGQYERSIYGHFDELIQFLTPEAFQIGTQIDTYTDKLSNMGTVYISTFQAAPRAILSQIQSVFLSNEVRRLYETNAGPSDAVVKLRFDLAPTIRMLNEIDYVVGHADYPIFFAPSPHWHGHPGGGGGCGKCHAFFDEHWRRDDYKEDLRIFRLNHPIHTNDICDIYAISGPDIMNHYCNMFSDICKIYKDVKLRLLPEDDLYLTRDDPDNSRIKTIVGMRKAEWDTELSPVFVPEKFIRIHMSPFLAIHGESVFEIMRR